MSSNVASNVLATIGTVLWCIQLIPQIIRNYRVKDCEGLPPLMLFIWAASGVPFSIYFIASDGSIPLQIQPQLFTFFCLISWVQSLYYPPVSLPRKKLILAVLLFLLPAIGLELGFILWLRPVYRNGTHWPMIIFTSIASVLLAIGLIPPYFELAKRRGRVVGINFIFLLLDSLGALFSMCSLFVGGNMDVMGIVLYAIVLGLELGIFACHIFWYVVLGGRKVIKEEKLAAQRLEEEKTENDETTYSFERSLTT